MVTRATCGNNLNTRILCNITNNVLAKENENLMCHARYEKPPKKHSLVVAKKWPTIPFHNKINKKRKESHQKD